MALNSAAFTAATASIENKISLPDFCTQLKFLGLPSSNSWAKTLAKLHDILNSANANPTDILNLELLVAWIADYLVTFSKAVRIYKLASCQPVQFLPLAQAIISGLEKAGVEKPYPYGDFPALADKSVCGLLLERFFLRDIEILPDSVSVVVTTASEYLIREKINVTPADSVALNKLSGYSEIIGVRRVAYEHVDVIRLSHGVIGSNLINADVILDISRPGDTALNQEEIVKRFGKYQALLAVAMQHAVGGGYSLPESMNFFQAMDKIYNSKDGNVCELGFATTLGGSVKKEKMKRNTADLRVETWHAGGRSAIAAAAIPDTIDIYRLSVSWKIHMSADQPILSIPGSYRALSNGDVRHALILGCTERSSFDFAYKRLLAYAI